MESAAATRSNFQKLHRLSEACERSVVLKYEDMIANWVSFAGGLTKYLTIRQPVLTEIYQRSRPREDEDMQAHQRSGKVGQFRTKLEEATVSSLNATFETILRQFQYHI